MRAAAKAAPGISIHPPRAGRDVINSRNYIRQTNFNPPAPCGAGQYMMCDGRLIIDISIHPPRAGRDKAINLICGDCMISIHPPRAGRDAGLSITLRGRSHFNPPAPCGAGHPYGTEHYMGVFISIHPPRAGRDAVRWLRVHGRAISIHPPRAGRDLHLSRWFPDIQFQSTRPVRGGTVETYFSDVVVRISIHPPRAGRDLKY